jgi:apolipoprotein D and lipocalin family protein
VYLDSTKAWRLIVFSAEDIGELMGAAHPALCAADCAASVNLPAVMGKFYVIGSVLTFLEKGATNAIERWTWNEAKQQVDVKYTFTKNGADGALTTITQRAFVHDTATNAEWRFQPFWPLKIPFFILSTGGDANGAGYDWVVAAVADRSFCWIMSRSPTMDDAVYAGILSDLEANQFDVSKISKTPQIWPDVAAAEVCEELAAAPAVAEPPPAKAPLPPTAG